MDFTLILFHHTPSKFVNKPNVIENSKKSIVHPKCKKKFNGIIMLHFAECRGIVPYAADVSPLIDNFWLS